MVQLFFKWIRRHLRINAFYGASENAVKTQIWIAVSVRKRLGVEALFEKAAHFYRHFKHRTPITIYPIPANN